MKRIVLVIAAALTLMSCCKEQGRQYRNYLAEIGYSQEEIDAKLQAACYEVFESERRAYQDVGDDMGYVADVKNNDVRTEGQSYGMMVCLQMGWQDRFDRIWRWCKKYMRNEDGPWAGMYAWHCRCDGTKIDLGSASDGELYFVTDLLLASRRWGNKGNINYLAEAQELLNTLASREYSILNADHHLINFTPDRMGDGYTDASYHLPAFMEVWAESAQDGRSDFYRECAAASREFLHAACNPKSGIAPDQSDYDGKPLERKFGRFSFVSEFHYDSWRVPMNITMDYNWYGKDAEWQKEYGEKIQATMASYGIREFPDQFSWEGGEPAFVMGAGGYRTLRHSIGLVATIASVSMMTGNEEFVRHLWEMKLEPYEDGYYDVYYDGLLYIFSLLHLSGNYRCDNWD